MSNIQLMHFINGEDIIGDVTETTGEHFVVENPCSISLVQGENGQPSLSLQPLVFFSKDKIVRLNKSQSMYIVGVDNQIEMQYNQIFGNLIVPQKKIIT